MLVLWYAYQMLLVAELKKPVQVGILKFYRVSVSSLSNSSPWSSIHLLVHDLIFFFSTDSFFSPLMWAGSFSHVSTSRDTIEVFSHRDRKFLDKPCLGALSDRCPSTRWPVRRSQLTVKKIDTLPIAMCSHNMCRIAHNLEMQPVVLILVNCLSRQCYSWQLLLDKLSLGSGQSSRSCVTEPFFSV
jgi:hypothetical protein